MKKRDFIIIALFLALALAGLLVLKLFAFGGSIRYADVYLDNELYAALPLNKDTVIEVDQGEGMINRIEVKGGAVFMLEASCPDKLCVSQGMMDAENYESRPMLNWIICLPNRVSIKLRLE